MSDAELLIERLHESCGELWAMVENDPGRYAVESEDFAVMDVCYPFHVDL